MEWLITGKDRRSFRDFLLALSSQMLTYDPRQQMCLQDENSRTVTKTGKQNAAAYITRCWEKDGVSKALRWQRPEMKTQEW